MRSYALVIAFALTLCGCMQGTVKSRPQETIRVALSDVVDAVQFAVDQAAAEIEAEKIWAATDQEIKHWSEACKLAKGEAVVSCRNMLNESSKLCASDCVSGNCGPAHDEICRRYLAGEDRAALCAAATPSAWCNAALTCAEAKEKRDTLCEGAKSLAKPELISATLTVSVEQNATEKGKISVILFSLGRSSSKTATNSVSVTLKPRVRSADYGSGKIAALPPNRTQISSEAKTLGTNLQQLIANSVRSLSKEYESTPQGQQVARPPMAVSGLTVAFTLVLDKDGSLGLKKEWTMPAGIELGAERSSKRSNSLTIVYGRQE